MSNPQHQAPGASELVTTLLLTPPSSDLTQPSSVLLVSVYDRNKNGEGFLGMLTIKPVLKDGFTLDQWYKLGTRGNEVVTGEIWIQCTFTATRVSILTHT